MKSPKKILKAQTQLDYEQLSLDAVAKLATAYGSKEMYIFTSEDDRSILTNSFSTVLSGMFIVFKIINDRINSAYFNIENNLMRITLREGKSWYDFYNELINVDELW